MKLPQKTFDDAFRFKDDEEQKIEFQNLAHWVYEYGRSIGMKTTGELLDEQLGTD